MIVTVEEHTVIGGLGSAVAEFLAETDLLAGTEVPRIGIPDVFPSGLRRPGRHDADVRHLGRGRRRVW